ncbi:MAG: 50S ribosomal protein L11 methyltransferase, partial [Bdellovibrionaceae bacterium]|nr:50S ribosomal protein L11 methyltransferase [Pseudobdellovibrionaceae bacterium]
RRANEDDFTELCFAHGAQGVAEDLAFSQPEVIFDPTVIEKARFDMNAYFAESPGEDFVRELKSRFPEADISITLEPQQDWMENWKKGFEPFLFVDPFWIVPSWREIPAEAKEVLLVDPGMAFGTGTHETTRLAARLIVGAWPQIREAAGRPPRVLDVGTGTGVLALVAHKLGAGGSMGLDIDPEARRVARENIKLNVPSSEVDRIEVPDTQLHELPESFNGTFDLVVANIIDGVLVKLRADLFRLLKPGGTLVLSGILTEREGPFLEEFLAGRTERNRRRVTMSEWSAFLVR